MGGKNQLGSFLESSTRRNLDGNTSAIWHWGKIQGGLRPECKMGENKGRIMHRAWHKERITQAGLCAKPSMEGNIQAQSHMEPGTGAITWRNSAHSLGWRVNPGRVYHTQSPAQRKTRIGSGTECRMGGKTQVGLHVESSTERGAWKLRQEHGLSPTQGKTWNHAWPPVCETTGRG